MDYRFFFSRTDSLSTIMLSGILAQFYYPRQYLCCWFQTTFDKIPFSKHSSARFSLELGTRTFMEMRGFLYSEKSIRFAPCRWHQAKPGWQAITTDGSSSSLPQREAAGFHFAPLSCFSQCQWGWKTYLQMMTCSMALPNAGWRLRK